MYLVLAQRTLCVHAASSPQLLTARLADITTDPSHPQDCLRRHPEVLEELAASADAGNGLALPLSGAGGAGKR